MKIVLAGNYGQYLDWLRANGHSPKDYRCVFEDRQIMGLELAASDIVLVGTHWESEIDRNLLRTRILK